MGLFKHWENHIFPVNRHQSINKGHDVKNVEKYLKFLFYSILFFFERASLIFIDQMVVNNNKILYRGVNAQCTIINPSQA